MYILITYLITGITFTDFFRELKSLAYIAQNASIDGRSGEV